MTRLHQRLTVVLLTYNRIDELLRTLEYMTRLPEQPAMIVVDNASTDSTPAIVAKNYPQVRIVTTSRNMGAAARNIGVQLAQTPYVAFCDDDSWWAGGSLERAVGILDMYPVIAAVCGRVLLGDAEREDPICGVMAASPLPSTGMPGPVLLGFIACAVVFRRQAYLDAGGYEEKFFVGGEEELLTLDLAAAGWRIVYVPQLTVHHHPSPQRDNPGRQKIVLRNALWVAWLRLPAASAWAETRRLCRSAPSWQVLKAALLNAARELPWVLRKRRVLPQQVHSMFRQLRT
ncbi:MAG TPA: glycosyltransferase [Noviherbaspirillum sp.]|jgi:GT2 family glycosyltransferase|uniref:glycosyltransferase family 2 protein n=1 Tax=Noviherbaspirillum sp. TaxID=1926288 RepID=UPI002DDD5573|nr:glycosyltransferase [Noviherbaspirillum sp.]HEV2611911.1 glycosyltransferase [Noviherbaspirillum sp.]